MVLLLVLILTNKTHHLYGKIMTTPKDLKHGLMFRKQKLNNKEGMLFVMKQNYDNSVWMKNTYISLDVIFLDGSMKVVGFKTNTTPLSTKTVKINQPSSYILEMNANSVNQLSINIGDSIQFNTNHP